MRSTLIATLSFAVALAAGCKPDGKPEARPAPVEAAAPVPSPVDTYAAQPEAGEAMRSLAGRLAHEAANRPGGTARVEDVLTALGAAGVELEAVKQYVGLTAAARYCAGGRTAAGLAVAVCEYASPADAAAGRAHVEQTFANVPGRQIAIRGATTLTTTAPDVPGAAALRARALEAFAAM